MFAHQPSFALTLHLSRQFALPSCIDYARPRGGSGSWPSSTVREPSADGCEQRAGSNTWARACSWTRASSTIESAECPGARCAVLVRALLRTGYVNFVQL